MCDVFFMAIHLYKSTYMTSLMQQLDWPDTSSGQGLLLLGPWVPCFVFFLSLGSCWWW